jgi:precorrin-2/cobalt-factor-2 C20-methyltransferase
MTETNYGRLIGASLGPGDPGLITRRAWEALNSPARWVYPVKQLQEDSYALGILRRAGIAIPEDAQPLHFPMTSDPEILARAWASAAARSLELLADGRDLVFLVEGDASSYSTFGHLARALPELEPAIDMEVIPGVSSFAAAAACVGEPLAEEGDTMAVLPASYGVEVIDRLLDELDTLVLFKVKPILDEVLDLLERRGLLASACFIEKVGAPGERVVEDVARLRGETVAYLSLLLVRNPNRARGELHRGCRPRRGVHRVAAELF